MAAISKKTEYSESEHGSTSLPCYSMGKNNLKTQVDRGRSIKRFDERIADITDNKVQNNGSECVATFSKHCKGPEHV